MDFVNDTTIKLTEELINEYQKFLKDQGYRQQTINMYICYLNRLCEFLPQDKTLTVENMERWIRSLKEEGYSDRTINMHISSVNGMFRFCGRGAAVPFLSVSRDMEGLRMTRHEYLQLLSYAKEHGSGRDYLLIKTLAAMDICVTYLPLLTAEACQKGWIEISPQRKVEIPDSLRQELLAYIQEERKERGPVFTTRGGKQLDRSNITHMIRQFGREAGIDPKKCNPRALHNMYQHTQEGIMKHIADLRTQIYDKLLEEEKEKVS